MPVFAKRAPAFCCNADLCLQKICNFARLSIYFGKIPAPGLKRMKRFYEENAKLAGFEGQMKVEMI